MGILRLINKATPWLLVALVAAKLFGMVSISWLFVGVVLFTAGWFILLQIIIFLFISAHIHAKESSK